MSTTPTAEPRIRKRFWFDPRFAIGLALVIASVVGVYAIVSLADSSSTVYTARAPLAAGDSVHPSDFVPTTVRLGAADRLYLAGGDLPVDGAVITRSIAAGELVPASAIARVADTAQTSVVVTVAGDLAESITPGATVDLWAAAQKERGQFEPPAVLAAAATVVRVIEGESLVATRDGTSVEIRVPTTTIAAVLAAVANADALSLVPATGQRR